jgi:nicotinate-nucleotide adenylyltransferase
VRIGLLGGSFDPPHNGHLLAAGDACEALALDRLLFIPAAVQPLKVGQTSAPPNDRLEMVRLLVDGESRFDVDPIEIDRGGLSYTVDTLATFAGRWPSAELFWLVGADVLKSFAQWREPRPQTERATGLVVQRAGRASALTTMAGLLRADATRRIDISSTEIRQRAREGKSIRGFVPDAVAAYIAAQRLYR